jgi:tRNA A-37 threonylcarbamoyl transferase component Bud32
MATLIALPHKQAFQSTFERWWQSRGEWVEAPNQRRGGESGVQRLRSQSGQQLYLKRQVGHLYRSWLHPFGQPTVLREVRAMRALTRLEVRVPALVYYGAQKHAGQWRALLVTEALDGFVSLEQWYAGASPQPRSEELNQQVLQQLAVTLSRMHLGRWQHGCLYSKHIFVKHHPAADGGWVEVALLDLEKCRRRIVASHASQRDLAQLYRHRGAMPEADWRVFVEAYNCFIRAVEPYHREA